MIGTSGFMAFLALFTGDPGRVQYPMRCREQGEQPFRDGLAFSLAANRDQAAQSLECAGFR